MRRRLATLTGFLCLIGLAATVRASDPAWWTNSTTQVIDPNADHSTSANYAPANIGQLKNFAAQARNYLDWNFAGGAGDEIETMVNGFSTDPSVNYAPANIGQLKAVARPLYDRLIALGYNTTQNLKDHGYPSSWTSAYPWDTNHLVPTSENYAPANIGQLKSVFSFGSMNFSVQVTLPESTSADIAIPISDSTATVSTAPAHGVLTGSAPSFTYQPYAHYNGTDSFVVTSSAGVVTVNITITPVDDPPLVDAGPNQTLTIPNGATSVSTTLSATVTDIDSTSFTYTWSADEGPGSVTFGTPTAASTTATFNATGTYTLRVTVSDGTSTRSDSLLVFVNSAASALSVSLGDVTNPNMSPASIPLTATVTGGTPSEVDFYEGSRQIGSSTVSPYSMAWSKSLPGTYRITAIATDSTGHTAISAPILVQVLGAIGTVGAGTDSTNGPGNDGNPTSGGDGGAASGGSGTPTTSDNTPPLDPNADDDGDGVKNGQDQYPHDSRRSQDIPAINYAVIDLGKLPATAGGTTGIMPDGQKVDKVALGSDGRVAFSWQKDTDYQVAKWKDGQFTDGSPKSTATQICFAIYPNGVTLPSRGGTTAPSSYLDAYTIFQNQGEVGSSILNSNGDITASEIRIDPAPTATDQDYDDGYDFVICTFGTQSANDLRSAEEAYDNANGWGEGMVDTPDLFLDNGTALGTNGWEDGVMPNLSSEDESGVRKRLYLKTDVTGTHIDQTVESSESGGGIAINWVASDSFDGANDEGGVAILDLQGGKIELPTTKGADALKAGTVQAINDSKEFLLAKHESDAFLYYEVANNAASSDGELKEMLDKVYKQQIRVGPKDDVSDAWMVTLNNSGKLLFHMDDLEQISSDTANWVGSYFISDKNPTPAEGDPNPPPKRSLEKIILPDGWDVSFLPKITDDNVMAGYIKKTKDDTGTAIPSADQVNRPGTVFPCEIAVDANRDGTIVMPEDSPQYDSNNQPIPVDVTTQNRPFRFWLNNDDDRAPAYGSASEGEVIPSGGIPQGDEDSAQNTVLYKRDLEDFARLHINIGGLQDAIANGTIQVGLEWRNVTGTSSPSIKIYQAAEPDGGEEYIRGGEPLGNENWANTQILAPFNTALGTVDGTGGFKFPAAFWQSNSYGLPKFSADHPKRYLLFEGVTEGKGQLVLTFWRGTTKIGEGGGIWMNLLDVRKMYRRAKITVTAPQIPGPWSNANPPPLHWVWDFADGAPDMDPNADKKTIVFVHGWRITSATALSWGDTTFKRLWHLGYKGNFYSFRWPTYSGEDGGYSPIDAKVPGGSTYNPSEYRAWLSGPALASFVNGLPNPNARFLIAHSMGNVVAGVALRNGMQVTRYAACNAAMAAMAYDPTIVDHSDWITPDSPDPDSDSSTRETFGLAGKFGARYTTIINFALHDDSATGGLWNANNFLLKPQNLFADGSFYKYVPLNAIGDKLEFENILHIRRSVTSVPEAMGYVTQSRSDTLGTKLSIGGSINAIVNMGAEFNFGTTHSAEWEYSIQPTYPFWKEILNKFQIDVGNR